MTALRVLATWVGFIVTLALWIVAGSLATVVELVVIP